MESNLGYHPLIIPGDNLLKRRNTVLKVLQDSPSLCGTSSLHMLPDQIFHFLNIMRFLQRRHDKPCFVQASVKIVFFIQHVHDASGHSRSKVLPCPTENDNPAAGHILAAVVSDALDHRTGTGVPHTEAFPCHTGNKGFA